MEFAAYKSDSASSWSIFTLLSICCALFVCTDAAVVSKQKSLGDIFYADIVDVKELAGNVKIKLPSKPIFLEGHGIEGVNYDLDNRSRPYINCDFYDVSWCDPTKQNCPTSKMCYVSANDHRLGCMAALVNNSSTKQVTLKGCWTHDGNLGNCDSNKCIADERPTGHGSAALFCCCNTHDCNRQVHFPPQGIMSTSVTTTLSTIIDDPGLFSSDNWLAAITILGIFVACLLFLLCYWTFREFRSSQHYKTKTSDAFSLPIVGDAKAPLIGCGKEEGWRNILNLTIVARGRFGEVYRGMLDDAPVAVKIFPPVDVNSWIVEQEIYAIPSLRKHENILHYLGAEVHATDYWLITEFHDNGSLYDFLRFRILSLHEALKVIATMLKGLSFLHEEKLIDGELKPSIVHRDFKSKNVLLKSDLTAVVADFGLALKCENGQMPADDNHGQVGTRRYMSPEVLEGATEFTAFAFRQIDVYAAALVLWEILSRVSLFEGDVVNDYQRPYEAEAGLQPTLHDLRRVVAVQKFRPMIRAEIVDHNIGGVLWKTAVDMWDMEADGRITSGCAFERANTLYLSYAVEKSAKPGSENHSKNLQSYSSIPCTESSPSMAESEKNYSFMDEYAKACSAPPNVRCTSHQLSAACKNECNTQNCTSGNFELYPANSQKS